MGQQVQNRVIRKGYTNTGGFHRGKFLQAKTKSPKKMRTTEIRAAANILDNS